MIVDPKNDTIIDDNSSVLKPSLKIITFCTLERSRSIVDVCQTVIYGLGNASGDLDTVSRRSLKLGDRTASPVCILKPTAQEYNKAVREVQRAHRKDRRLLVHDLKTVSS